MPQTHLSSLRIGNALREVLHEGYTRRDFGSDLQAGITVGIIAIPLSMALAIASGVPPQHGLYTALIAGFLIALTGGSRYSVSGPTAAFVVLLLPVVQQFGLAGLAMATFLSGVILVVMAITRLGRLIQYIPEAVSIGFTGGIAIVIATLQVRDFLGLRIEEFPEHWLDKLVSLAGHMDQWHGPSAVVAGVTLATLLLWNRLRTPVPPALAAIVVGSLVAAVLAAAGLPVDTIGSRFHYLLPDGTPGSGIPPVLPQFALPWQLPGPGGVAMVWDTDVWRALLPAAFAIAMLGAIESLLCAVVVDGMTGKRHSANSELLGQGIGNMVVPFFGGITATAAIARSAANVRAGARSPVAAVIHAAMVLLSIILMAPALAWLPMPSMAALLLMVAWNMSEAPKGLHLLRTAPRADVIVFLTCLSLTVLVDMVVAIGVGVTVAALLFMREVAHLTRVTDISDLRKHVPETLPAGWRVLKINGPLFFAAADRVFAEIGMRCDDSRGLVLYLDGVSTLDGGGLNALLRLVERAREQHVELVLADLQFQPLKTLRRAQVAPEPGLLHFTATLSEALDWVQQRVTDAASAPPAA